MPKFDISKYRPSPPLIENQPLYAYVEVKIGGTVVTDFGDDISDTLISLNITRTTGGQTNSAGNKFNLQLYDDTALEIESIIYGTMLETANLASSNANGTSQVTANGQEVLQQSTRSNPGQSTGGDLSPIVVTENVINNAKAQSGKSYVAPTSESEVLSSWNGQKSMWGNNGYTPATFIADAYAKSGVDIRNGGSISEGNLQQVLSEYGFEAMSYMGEENLKPGDILIDGNNMGIYETQGKMLSATMNENGEGVVGSNRIKGSWKVVYRYTTDTQEKHKKTSGKDKSESDKQKSDSKSTGAGFYEVSNFFKDAISANPFGDPVPEGDEGFQEKAKQNKKVPDGTTTDKSESEGNNTNSQDSSLGKGKKNKKGSSTGTSINNILITYGWVSRTGEIITSKSFNGNFVKYSLDFENASTILSIEGTTTATANISSPSSSKTKEYPASKYGGVPSAIVKDIMKEEGVSYDDTTIIETRPVLDDNGNPKTFTRNGETAESFINKNLVEEATSLETGEVGYSFYIGDDNKAYFKPSHAQEGSHVQTATVITSDDKAQVANALNNAISGATGGNADLSTVSSVVGAPVFNSPAILGDGDAARTIYIGDSRVVGLCATSGGSSGEEVNEKVGDIAFCGKTGEGLGYMRGTAWDNAKQYVGEGTRVVSFFGVNDLGNIDGYCSYLNQLNQQVSAMGGELVVASVGPVNEEVNGYAYSVTNAEIDEFNKKLQKACEDNGITYIDVNSELKEPVKNGSSDGLHYNDELNKKIIEMTSGGNTAKTNDSKGAKNSSGGVSNKPLEIVGFYEFYSGQNNNQVISFSPVWNDMSALGASNLASSVEAVDTMRNEIISTMVKAGGYQLSDVFSGSKDRIMGKSSSTMEKLSSLALSMWQKNYARQNEATLELMGDPQIEVGKYLYIDVFTKYGFRHHTSGVYFIKQAEDSISDGTFTSTLQLQKHGPNETKKGKGGGMENGKKQGGAGSGVSPDANVEKAVQWMIDHANDDSHGYSQANRYGPDYDCSSSVSKAFQEAGFGQADALADDSMIRAFEATGQFEWIPGENLGGMDSCDNLQRGDILLGWHDDDNWGHVEVYIGGGQKVGAHSSRGNPETGDQDSTEFSVQEYFNTEWRGVIRYKGSGNGGGGNTK